MSKAVHPGYILSRHCASDDATWYKEDGSPSWYVGALFCGDYSPCGTSGSNLMTMYEEKKRKIRIGNHGQSCYSCYESRNVYACGFVFGAPCDDDILDRKWSCCDNTFKGKLQDGLLVEGCTINK
jgi:hypothetical protein